MWIHQGDILINLDQVSFVEIYKNEVKFKGFFTEEVYILRRNHPINFLSYDPRELKRVLSPLFPLSK